MSDIPAPTAAAPPSPAPPIWLLGLARTAARSAPLQQQLRDFGLHAELVEGIDARAPGDVDLAAATSPWRAMLNFRRELAPSEVAVALSHLRLYERMLAEGLDEVVILEDDAVLLSSFPVFLSRRGHLPRGWDVVNLANDQAGVDFRRARPLFRDHLHHRFLGIANRTTAYLIRRRGAAKLLRRARPIRYPADELIGRTEITGLRLYGIWPHVARHGDRGSVVWETAAAIDADLPQLRRPPRLPYLAYRALRKAAYLARRPHRAGRRK